MSAWINLSALWRIVVLGVLFGAGLPAVFGVGLRALSLANPDVAADGAAAARPRPVAWVGAVICFAGVLAAVGAGIYLVVAGT